MIENSNLEKAIDDGQLEVLTGKEKIEKRENWKIIPI